MFKDAEMKRDESIKEMKLLQVIKLKATDEQHTHTHTHTIQANTHRHRQQYGSGQREKEVGGSEG